MSERIRFGSGLALLVSSLYLSYIMQGVNCDGERVLFQRKAILCNDDNKNLLVYPMFENPILIPKEDYFLNLATEKASQLIIDVHQEGKFEKIFFITDNSLTMIVVDLETQEEKVINLHNL